MPSPVAIRLLFRVACFLPLLGVLLVADWAAGLPPVRRLVMRDLNGAVDALNAGKPVWGWGDQRDLRSAAVLRLQTRPDVLILGSSRLANVSANWFLPRTAFNAAVFGGDLEDMVSIFQVCAGSGRTPSTVVLELNPSLTYEGHSQTARLLAPHLRAAMWRYHDLPTRFFTGLFSLDALRWDLRALSAPRWYTSGAPHRGMSVILPDGALAYAGSTDKPDADGTVARWSMQHLDALTRRWRTNSRPDPSDLKLLRDFLDDMQSRGIQVTLLLPPIHPAAYRYYYDQGGYHEDWMRREMAKRGVPIVGSFSPFAANATTADFFDDVHPQAELTRRLLAGAGLISGAP